MSVNPDQIGFLIGVAFCAIVGGQAVLALLGARRNLVHQHEAASVRLAIMNEELGAALQRRQLAPVASNSWQGYRRFVVKKTYRESPTTRTIHLAPQDRRPLPRYFPGQFLTLRFEIPGQPSPAVRCYSLSDRPRQEYFRCTIKSVATDESSNSERSVSHFVNRSLQEGDIVEAQAPSGEFVLDLFDRRPAVLLAGGVGITPMMSMLRTVAHERTDRELILFYGVRNGEQHVFRDEIAAVAQECPNIRVITCYSKPLGQDQPGRDYDVEGRVSIELVREQLATNNYEFFLCGPDRFLSDLETGLRDWGVADHRIRLERFAPNVSSPTVTESLREPKDLRGLRQSTITIRFEASGQSIEWNDDFGSILECAEQQGVYLPAGCRQGNCGTCLAAMVSGKVSYEKTPGYEVDEQQCLPCLARPAQDVKLDL